MKKFVVESNKDIVKDDVNTCLHNMDHYAFGTFKVTELPSIPEVKMVETGVLMSPAEICKCDLVDSINIRWAPDDSCTFPYSISVFKSFVGQRIDISKHRYPREFYRDIQKTWNFASIPLGSLIRIDGTVDVWDIGYFESFYGNIIRIRSGSHRDIEWSSDNIKSIRIVELPKDGE